MAGAQMRSTEAQDAGQHDPGRRGKAERSSNTGTVGAGWTSVMSFPGMGQWARGLILSLEPLSPPRFLMFIISAVSGDTELKSAFDVSTSPGPTCPGQVILLLRLP